eukprot:UN04795
MENLQPRHEWIYDNLRSSFTLKENQIQDWFKSDNFESTFEKWIAADKGATLFFTELNETKKKELCCYQSQPPSFQGKCVYFIKNTSNPKGLLKNRSDENVFCGELTRDGLLCSLQKSISGIYDGLLRCKNDWGQDEERRTFLKQSNEFSDFLQRQIVSVDTHITTPLPKILLEENDIAIFDKISYDSHPTKKKDMYFQCVT